VETAALKREAETLMSSSLFADEAEDPEEEGDYEEAEKERKAYILEMKRMKQQVLAENGCGCPAPPTDP